MHILLIKLKKKKSWTQVPVVTGGASAAYKCDVWDRLFKVHGRWKSENAKDGYVCEDLEKTIVCI
jgi:hypothetical protein